MRAASVLLTVAIAGAAAAQSPQVREPMPPPIPGYSAKISPDRLQRLAALPDWSGVWLLYGSPALISTEHDVSFRKGNRNAAPYKPEWAARYESEARRGEQQGDPNAADPLTDSHTIYCAAGLPRDIATPLEYQFFLAPERTVINIGGEVRQIYTDGRSFPPADEMWPRFWAWSIGHWEGETLVIETRGLKPGLWADPTPMKLSEKAAITERLRRINPDIIENDVTIVDPVAFDRPWHFVRHYRRLKDQTGWMDEKEVCGGPEDRNPLVDGKVTIKLKQ